MITFQPHATPRQFISRNDHHLQDNQLSQLFPWVYLAASCRRLPNLWELFAPTVEKTVPPVGRRWWAWLCGSAWSWWRSCGGWWGRKGWYERCCGGEQLILLWQVKVRRALWRLLSHEKWNKIWGVLASNDIFSCDRSPTAQDQRIWFLPLGKLSKKKIQTLDIVRPGGRVWTSHQCPNLLFRISTQGQNNVR